MQFLAIDLGTSFVKGAVLDLDRMRIQHVQRAPVPQPHAGTSPLFRECDPSAMVDSVRSMVGALLEHTADCSGIVMCGQMHGLVLSGDHGEALTPAVTWLDQRVLQPHPSGQGTFFDVLSGLVSPSQRQQLGNELRPGLPLCSLFWLAESGLLPPVEAIPASIPDFVLATLCGTAPRAMDATNAAAHGAMSVETLDWHHEVLTRLHLDHLAWPPVCRTGDVVAELRWGSRSIPCYAPLGDFQASLAGAFLREGELSLNISTGSQVSMIAPGLQYGNFQNRPYVDGRLLRTITHIPAGRSLSVLVNLLCEIPNARGQMVHDPWSYTAEAVQGVGEPGLAVDLAFFASSFGNRGAISNISEETLTVGHLFRAAFENMAGNYLQAALRLSPDRDWQDIVFSGGLAQRFPLLRQLICDRLQKPYRLCAVGEDSLLGLLALALNVSGRNPSVADATDQLARQRSSLIEQ
jgi:sugar (pentulose or hexulose) kinase